MADDLRAKALGYIREGKVAIKHARTHTRTMSDPPHEVIAFVDGYHGRHVVDYVDAAWTCTCGQDGCAHAAAVALVTGHQSAAAKPAKAEKSAAA